MPLLMYVPCAVEQKTHLSTFDMTILTLNACMIFTGFLLNLRIPYGLAVFFLLCSFLCLAIISTLSIINYRTVSRKAKGKKYGFLNYFPEKQTLRKATLLLQLNVILWYYPTVYMLAAAGAIDHNVTFAAYMLGSVFGKVIFSSLVVESHVKLLYEFLLTTSQNSNLAGDDSEKSYETEKSASHRSHGRNSHGGLLSGHSAAAVSPEVSNERVDSWIERHKAVEALAGPEVPEVPSSTRETFSQLSQHSKSGPQGSDPVIVPVDHADEQMVAPHATGRSKCYENILDLESAAVPSGPCCDGRAAS